jgi:DNA mismatch repair ATPase MutS
MRRLGYPFCYPCFSQEKVVRIEGGYDLALAQEEGVPVSAGDFLRDVGQSFLITGPNHGGKTTYACMVGQILYLASLGLPVPCRVLQTYFLSALYTHFAKAEDLSNNAGRLKEELQRLKAILDRLAEDSFVIFNDLFASTTTYDARQMGKQILERFAARGCLFLFVTSIGELAEDCPSLKVLCAAKEEGGSAYVVANGTGRLSSGRSRWAEQYHLRREDIQGRVGL